MAPEAFVICRMVIGSPSRVTVDEKEYRMCSSAVGGLQEICDAEEKYENLIENYVEWESAISQHALRQMVSFEIGYNEVQDSRKFIARKLFNLLASARLYLDSLPKHTKRIFPEDQAAVQCIKNELSAQYDSRLSYRVMEALRNYSQHAALPIHGITTHASWDRASEPYALSFAVLPTLDRKQLAEDGNFKKSVLDEILQLEKIELKLIVREYIESVSLIHNAFRKAIGPKSGVWVTQLASSTGCFAREFPDEGTIGLAVLPVDDRGLGAGEPVYIAGPMVDYLAHMQQKHATMLNFAKRRVDF